MSGSAPYSRVLHPFWCSCGRMLPDERKASRCASCYVGGQKTVICTACAHDTSYCLKCQAKYILPCGHDSKGKTGSLWSCYVCSPGEVKCNQCGPSVVIGPGRIACFGCAYKIHSTAMSCGHRVLNAAMGDAPRRECPGCVLQGRSNATACDRCWQYDGVVLLCKHCHARDDIVAHECPSNGCVSLAGSARDKSRFRCEDCGDMFCSACDPCASGNLCDECASISAQH